VVAPFGAVLAAQLTIAGPMKEMPFYEIDDETIRFRDPEYEFWHAAQLDTLGADFVDEIDQTSGHSVFILRIISLAREASELGDGGLHHELLGLLLIRRRGSPLLSRLGRIVCFSQEPLKLLEWQNSFRLCTVMIA